ncbi:MULTISPECIES: ATP-binding protein [Microbacterium]|uniref:ATP-binding protein n=1 Tax=Microbacterium TaxID=33882 RepID=UPI0011EB0202|nr:MULTISPECIES: ATP-binding protein [Microbacterium]
MQAETRAFHVDGPAGFALVDRALDELDRLWSQGPEVPAQDQVLFALALSEVTTNIAQHNESADVVLSVDVRVTADELRAYVRDTAPPAPIDWDAVTMPGEEAESGRGLALSQAALDVFTHTVTDLGNTWVLVRRLDQQREADD